MLRYDHHSKRKRQTETKSEGRYQDDESTETHNMSMNNGWRNWECLACREELCAGKNVIFKYSEGCAVENISSLLFKMLE